MNQAIIDRFEEFKNSVKIAADQSCDASDKLCEAIRRSNGQLAKALIKKKD